MPTRPPTRRLLALPLAGALLAGTALPAVATDEQRTPTDAAFTLDGGVSAPVHSYADAIRETVWVDIGMDGDRDGVSDRVAADIIRPAEPAQAGLPVPVIMDASPYYSCCGRGNESQLKTYDAEGRPEGFPLFYDNYFVPRGYATVLVDLAGTNRSQGCVDVGGPSDVTSATAVVEWLNGAATGYTSPTGDEHASADWSTGAVGMIGKSYDGTIANGVAATGTPGLKTIVPIGAISSWYDYYGSDGAAFRNSPAGLARTVEQGGGRSDCGHVKAELDAGAPTDGDWTDLWEERDHTKDAANVQASVLAVHGLGDLNVKMIHFGRWWDALAEHDVPRKVWLTQAGHVDPFDFRREEWVDTLHRWFDRWLLEVPNGIDAEPTATIERAPDVWTDEPVWPPASTADVTLTPRVSGTEGLGHLGVHRHPPMESLRIERGAGGNQFAWAESPDQPADDRLLFYTPPLSRDARIAGTGSVTVSVSSSLPVGHLTATLVDYGPATTRDYLGSGEGIRTLSTRSCWGESTPFDDACYRDTETTTADVDLEIFARGWADIANHSSRTDGETLEPGQSYDVTFRLSTTDHVVPAGHQLALIIGGSDSRYLRAPSGTPALTVGLRGTSVDVPLVDGEIRFGPVREEPPTVREHRVPEEPMILVNGDQVRG
ncbi:X-Pro dipeptidyl-peptidase [Actinoalloteichus hoggarensis]|uniref:Xaa-Pro dipeptidyl-peptidase n=1 Tax=Actinoalloteichus hoggarensis TaxID=1470176 RepID=A0A221WAG1_9PSEU|nr:Xaa-Pro dipeptidyl-peptidase [Actinoalloteichus hoggarensis]ASO22566.1 Xaa-Pro dipeptidyl-peptidase [Actinoalloteichus hoggarensis]MBB5923009.1 X-Pro dipeptidyl-peptidase [Actinoalloteichus hoggarensis]